MKQATAGGIAVRFYLPRLSNADVHWLRAFAEESVQWRAPTFARWLIDTAENELMRRMLTRYDSPVEAEFPRLQPLDWTDSQLADYLLGSLLFSRAFPGHSPLKSLAESCALIIGAAVVARLTS